MSILENNIKNITDLDSEVMKKVRNRVDFLIKPQGSLGKLEDIVVQLSGITCNEFPVVDKKALIVMCSDHGVCDEGVASGDQSVTLQQTLNIPRGITGAGAMAKQSGTKIYSVDVGIKVDFEDELVYSRKIAYGSKNMSKERAMTRDHAIKALEVGIEFAEKAIKDGANILATGEMGIGNTTPSTAIVSVYTGLDPFEITGLGGNLPSEKLSHKAGVIKKSIKVNRPDKNDPIDVLSKVGGFDIAGMAGVMIGSAANKVPVVIDGFISTAAAIIACEIEPKVHGYLIPSHFSKEKGAAAATNYLNFKPFLDLDMRLGEGSGAILAFGIIESSCYMNKEMITFDQAGIKVV